MPRHTSKLCLFPHTCVWGPGVLWSGTDVLSDAPLTGRGSDELVPMLEQSHGARFVHEAPETWRRLCWQSHTAGVRATAGTRVTIRDFPVKETKITLRHSHWQPSSARFAQVPSYRAAVAPSPALTLASTPPAASAAGLDQASFSLQLSRSKSESFRGGFSKKLGRKKEWVKWSNSKSWQTHKLQDTVTLG